MKPIIRLWCFMLCILIAHAEFAYSQCAPNSCPNTLPASTPCPGADMQILGNSVACEGQPLNMQINNQQHTYFDYYVIDWDLTDVISPTLADTACCPGQYSNVYNLSNPPCNQDAITLIAGITIFNNTPCPNTPANDNFSTISLVIRPRAAISVAQDSVCENTIVQFNNLSCPGQTANISYLWDFGDGTTSTAFAPSHTFPTTGSNASYNVTLTVTNNRGGCNLTGTASLSVYIFGEPQIGYTLETPSISVANFNDTLCSSEPLLVRSISTNADSIRWSIRNQPSNNCANIVCASCPSTSINFSCPGNYEICLKVINPKQLAGNQTICEVDSCFTITVLPSASMSAFNLPACITQNPINLDPLITYNGTPSSVQWQVLPAGASFGGSGTNTYQGLYPGTLTLPTGLGVTYTVQATVSHPCNTSIVSRTVSLASSLTVPNNTIRLCPGDVDTIVLPAQPGVTYTWSASPNIIYQNTNGDTVIVTANVADSLFVRDNASAVCPGQDTVVIIPDAAATITPLGNVVACLPSSTISLPLPPTFPTACWTGPGVTNCNTFDPSQASNGDLLVLAVTATNGCSANDTATVVLSQTPNISIGNDTTICAGSTVPLTTNQPGGQWTHISGPNPSGITGNAFNPTTPGIDLLEYSYTNPSGCSSSSQMTITSQGAPPATVTASPTALCGTSGSSVVTVSTSANNTINWPANLTPTSTSTATANPISTTTYSIGITDTLGCTVTTTITIGVDTFPVPSMTFNPSACQDSLVFFQATSNSAYSYQWLIFDSQGVLSSSGSNISYSTGIPNPGSYDVLLIADNNGCKDTAVAPLQIVEPPVVSFSLQYDPVACSPLAVTVQPSFSGNLDSVRWERDGQTISTTNGPVQDVITVTGIDSVTVHYCGYIYSSCNTIQICDSVTVFPTSIAGVAISALNICPNDTLAIDNVTELESRVQYYILNYGNGIVDTLSSFGTILTQYPNTTDSFITYTISVTAIGMCNDTTMDKVSVTIAPDYLDPFITADPIRGCAPLTVNFQGASPGYPTNWRWDFGDGGSSSQQNPTYTYLTPGKYRPRLIVWNTCSIDTIYYDDPLNDSIEVFDSVIFDFETVPAEVCAGANVTLAVNAGSDVVGYAYSFGNGDSAFTQSPSYIYNAPGSYTIIGTATTAPPKLCKTSDTVTVTVHGLPDVTISLATDSIGCSPMQVIAMAPNNPAVLYDWSYGDESEGSVGYIAEHVYFNDSTQIYRYYLKLVAESIYGCIDSATQLIAVKPSSEAILDVEDLKICDVPDTVSIVNLTDRFSDDIHWFLNNEPIVGNDSIVRVPFDEPGDYIISMVAGNHFECYDTAAVMVDAFEKYTLYIPNAFSPNGDGTNDRYYVLGYNIDRINLQIFDRWGGLVFVTDDITEGWDGTDSNNDVTVGVYVYDLYVEYTNCNTGEIRGDRYKGSIMVMK